MTDLALTAESPSRSPLAQEVARRRTFAIISHPDAGKTTLTEKLLLFGGAINLAGQVKAKGERRNTRSDWMKIERERGISVVTSVMTFEFEGLVFNLLDTPGHEDFSEDTYRTLTHFLESECDIFITVPGLNSLYFWTGKMPRSYSNFGHVVLQNHHQQTQLIAALGKAKRPLIIVREAGGLFSFTADTGPLGKLISQQCREIRRIGWFRILEPQQTIAP